MGDENVRVAALQMCSGLSPEANLDVIARLSAEAAAAGAHYVLTPEVSIAFARDRAELATLAGPMEDNPALKRCAEIARETGLFLHLGSLAVALENGLFANRSVLFSPDGQEVARYDKIHLFDADPPNDRPYRESASYQGGTEAVVTQAPGFGLGMSICYDVRFPQLFATLANGGAGVMAVPAAFTVPTGRAHWEILLRARAIETGSYVIAAAQAGQHENGRATWGHSMIVDPWGAVVSVRAEDSPGLVLADIDPVRVRDARERLPALANARPFSLSVNQGLS